MTPNHSFARKQQWALPSASGFANAALFAVPVQRVSAVIKHGCLQSAGHTKALPALAASCLGYVMDRGVRQQTVPEVCKAATLVCAPRCPSADLCNCHQDLARPALGQIDTVQM